MRQQLLKTAVAMVLGVGVFAGARVASAATHGVVFIHGTGDSPGTMTCSGQNCTVSAAYGGSGYWYPGEVASIANGRPYAVVGFDGGSCAPWPQSGDSSWNRTSTGSACPLPSTQSNSDVIVGQIQQFLNTGISEIVLVTHSGGSNYARYIMENYTRSASYTAVKNATVRVITVAGPTRGTYLANEVFGGGIGGYITGALAGWVGYGGEGVNFIRTNYMSTYNSTSSYLGNPTSPVNGVNFYSTGGRAGVISCVGFKVWGVCIGISNVRTLDGDATPLSACDSVLDDTALLVLHDVFLDANDNSTARSTTGANGGSDGFISVNSSTAMGNVFALNSGQDHNMSRHQCNNEDVNIRNFVSSSKSGFSLMNMAGSYAVDPHQVDACGFGVAAQLTNSTGSTVAYTEGCTKAQLGNGNCDWDCVALYGNDAVVTQWDSTGTKPLAWGASDCAVTTNTYNGATYTDTSTSPFDEAQTYTNASGTFWTQFDGHTCTGTAAQCGGNDPAAHQWFYDPNFGSATQSAGVCPKSWIGDGICDECVLALYGNDGMDCVPGRIVQCSGIVTGARPYSGSSYFYDNNPIYNEATPASGGSAPFAWSSMAAVAGDGVCENTECTQGTAAAIPTVVGTTSVGTPCTGDTQCPGTLACNTATGLCAACTTGADGVAASCNSAAAGWTGNTCNPATGICFQTATLTAACGSSADCLVGGCVNGGCTTQGSDCSTTYNVMPKQCATSADCTGNACQSTGTCLLTAEACTSDANCSVPSGATSTCNSSGQCSCATSADCSGGAACTNGVCAGTVTTSLCK
jgi:hypothetical protein